MSEFKVGKIVDLTGQRQHDVKASIVIPHVCKIDDATFLSEVERRAGVTLKEMRDYLATEPSQPYLPSRWLHKILSEQMRDECGNEKCSRCYTDDTAEIGYIDPSHILGQEEK